MAMPNDPEGYEYEPSRHVVAIFARQIPVGSGSLLDVFDRPSSSEFALRMLKIQRDLILFYHTTRGGLRWKKNANATHGKRTVFLIDKKISELESQKIERTREAV